MSRSGYSEDYCDGDPLAFGRYRGAVKSATRGKRGQSLLQEIAAALDIMPIKELITGEIIQDGAVCSLGSVAVNRGMDVSAVDPKDPDAVAVIFNVAAPLVREITYMNDEWSDEETPAERWTRMRAWVASQIIKASTESSK